jgi:hypothetical protein
MLVCNLCWEPYDENLGLVREGLYCSRRRCEGQLWQVDELLLPSIILMMNKGYFPVVFSCGHFQAGPRKDAYIMFAPDETSDRLTTPPLGFTLDHEDDGSVVIWRRFEEEDMYKRYIAVAKASLDVLTWAQGLEEITGQ